MGEDDRWEQVVQEWARSEWLLRGKAHKGDVSVVARVLDPATGEYREFDLLPAGAPCDLVTYRVRVETVGHEDDGEE